MHKRIFDKIPLLLRFHTSKILLQPCRYNLKSTYNFQNKVNKYNALHLRYYSDPSPSSLDNTVINFDELQQLLKEKNNGEQKNLYIVDVREPFELNDGHIPHAINIPLNRFEEAITLSKEDFDEIYEIPKFNDDDQIILYCKAGQRSLVATTIAKHYGFFKARNYPGSWLEYSEKINK